MLRLIEDVGVTFEEQFSELSTRIEEATKMLHDRENIYRSTEDKLI